MIGLKTLILAVVVTMIAAALRTDVVFAQMKQDQEAADIPADLLPMLEKDLRDSDEDCSEQQIKENVGATWFDLTLCDVFPDDKPATTKPLPFSVNRLKHPVLLVEGDCYGGIRSQNWDHWLYVRAGNGWRKIFYDNFQDSLTRRCTSTHGLPDLQVYHTAGCCSGDQYVYSFDGKEYKDHKCNVGLFDTTSPCEIPSGFLAIFQRDLEHKKYLENARACLEKQGSPLKANVSVSWFDLRRPELALLCKGLTRVQTRITR